MIKNKFNIGDIVIIDDGKFYYQDNVKGKIVDYEYNTVNGYVYDVNVYEFVITPWSYSESRLHESYLRLDISYLREQKLNKLLL